MIPPAGTVTFLLSDIEGSTKFWEEQTEEMHVALARHDELMRVAIQGDSGYAFNMVGDGFYAAFFTALDGLTASHP